MLARVIGVLSGIVTLFAFLYGETGSNITLSPWKIGLITVFCISILGYLALEAYEYYRSRPITTKTDVDFHAFMARWLDHPGKVAILSANLSWGDPKIVLPKLEKKAASGDLLLIMEKPSALSRALESKGATVKYYQAIGYVPQSRFTVVRFRSPHGKVAVGWPRAERPGRLLTLWTGNIPDTMAHQC